MKKAEDELQPELSSIEKAEISDFEDESSILDEHLHEQQRRWMKPVPFDCSRTLLP